MRNKVRDLLETLRRNGEPMEGTRLVKSAGVLASCDGLARRLDEFLTAVNAVRADATLSRVGKTAAIEKLRAAQREAVTAWRARRLQGEAGTTLGGDPVAGLSSILRREAEALRPRRLEEGDLAERVDRALRNAELRQALTGLSAAQREAAYRLASAEVREAWSTATMVEASEPGGVPVARPAVPPALVQELALADERAAHPAAAQRCDELRALMTVVEHVAGAALRVVEEVGVDESPSEALERELQAATAGDTSGVRVL
jgi:hypothetical protein